MNIILVKGKQEVGRKEIYFSFFSIGGKEKRHLEGIFIYFNEFQVSLKTMRMMIRKIKWNPDC